MRRERERERERVEKEFNSDTHMLRYPEVRGWVGRRNRERVGGKERGERERLLDYN